MAEENLPPEVAQEVADVQTPVQINPSVAGEHAASGVRDLLICLGAFSAILGFIGKRDLAGLVNWLHSSEAYPFLGLVIAGATLAWRHIRLRQNKATLVKVGLSAPNETAVVLGVDVPKSGS